MGKQRKSHTNTQTSNHPFSIPPDSEEAPNSNRPSIASRHLASSGTRRRSTLAGNLTLSKLAHRCQRSRPQVLLVDEARQNSGFVTAYMDRTNLIKTAKCSASSSGHCLIEQSKTLDLSPSKKISTATLKAFRKTSSDRLARWNNSTSTRFRSPDKWMVCMAPR